MTMQDFSKQSALFLVKRISVAEFEAWVYANDGLKEVLGNNRYIELLSFPFNELNASTQLSDLLYRFAREINPVEFITQRAIVILELLLEDAITVTTGCRLLAELHHNGGEGIVPIEFVGYDSELDTVPEPDKYHLWNKDALEEQLQRISWYKDDIQSFARETLNELLAKTGGNLTSRSS